MNVFFISQGKGFSIEDAGENPYVRAPSDDGISTHTRINDIAPGDVIILYHAQTVYGIGFYKSSRYEPYPDTGIQSRIVYLDRIKFSNPIPKFRISQQLRDAQWEYAAGFPININLNVNQGYCYYATEPMLNIVLEHCDDDVAKATITEKINYSKENFESIPLENLINARTFPVIRNGQGGGQHNRPVGAPLPATELNPFEETIFKDERDEQEYRAIKIGGKTWLAENFRYQDSANPINGIYIVMTRENTEDYGYLYTWDAAQAACPAGWHLPTDEEWNKLFEDTYNVEMLINHYNFDCPKAGIRNPDHTIGKFGFCSFNENTVFWSASQNPRNANEASRFTMSDNTRAFTNLYMKKNFAFSVRYVKDIENE